MDHDEHYNYEAYRIVAEWCTIRGRVLSPERFAQFEAAVLLSVKGGTDDGD